MLTVQVVLAWWVILVFFLILTHLKKINLLFNSWSNVAGNLEFAAIYNWGFVRLWVFSAYLFLPYYRDMLTFQSHHLICQC